MVACGNLISDICDHFSQFCILKSMKDKIRVKKSKMRDFSCFSSDRLHADLSNVNWNALFSNESSDVHEQCILLLLQQIQQTGEQACTNENNF